MALSGPGAGTTLVNWAVVRRTTKRGTSPPVSGLTPTGSRSLPGTSTAWRSRPTVPSGRGATTGPASWATVQRQPLGTSPYRSAALSGQPSPPAATTARPSRPTAPSGPGGLTGTVKSATAPLTGP